MNIIERPHFGSMTTIRVGGHARALIEVGKEADLDRLAEVMDEHSGPPVVLGGGSNLLVRDGELDLVLVRKCAETTPVIVDQEEEAVRVRADGGCSLVRLLVWAAGKGLRGLEGLAGIPGTVGGGVAMNAGSHGQEFGRVLGRVQVWSPETGSFWAGPKGFVAGYRSFRLCPDVPWFLILNVELLLHRAQGKEVMVDYRNWLARKARVQPLRARTAGCVFKNPEGESAGRLLDQAGFRGARCGGMCFSGMHANFLANTGGGTFEQAMELIDQARAAVLKRHGVDLELEVCIVS